MSRTNVITALSVVYSQTPSWGIPFFFECSGFFCGFWYNCGQVMSRAWWPEALLGRVLQLYKLVKEGRELFLFSLDLVLRDRSVYLFSDCFPQDKCFRVARFAWRENRLPSWCWDWLCSFSSLKGLLPSSVMVTETLLCPLIRKETEERPPDVSMQLFWFILTAVVIVVLDGRSYITPNGRGKGAASTKVARRGIKALDIIFC